MTPIPPDLAEKVIGANLRNLVKKVSDGGVLTKEELELMERANIEGTLPDELQKARLAALMRRYATGSSLSKDQQRELSAILPAAKPIARRLTSETYRYRLSHYVPILGLTGKDPERKLKRWIATGRDKSPPDLPPFDQPHLMGEWWRRNMEWRVPDYLLRLEQKQTDGDDPPPTDSAPTEAADTAAKPPDTNEVTGLPVMLDMGAEVSSDIGLQQIRALVVATFNQLKRCLEAGHITQANNYRREWQSLVGTLRQWEKDIVKIQEGKGEVLRTRVINTELVRIFTVMNQSFGNALIAMAEELAPEMPPAERRQMALRLRDKCFLHIKASRFATTYQPPSDA